MAATANKTKKTRQDFAGAISKAVKKESEQTHGSQAKAEEKKTGRPSTGKTVKITLAIPEEYMEGISSAALLHKGNRTAYINSLIKKDLEENLTKYSEFNKMLSR